jgi:hypothetical protein
MDINQLFRKRNDDPGSLFGGKAQTETVGRYQKQIGERHEFILTCTAVITPATEIYSVKIYKFVDDEGNVFMNFANKEGDWFSGNKYRIRATVKAHKIYEGVRQTHIIRLKTLELFYDQPPVVATGSDAWDAI